MTNISSKQIAEQTFNACVEMQKEQGMKMEFADVVAIAMNTWCEFNNGAPEKQVWHSTECGIRHYLNKMMASTGVEFRKDVRKTGRPTKQQQFRAKFAAAVAQMV